MTYKSSYKMLHFLSVLAAESKTNLINTLGPLYSEIRTHFQKCSKFIYE